MSKKLLLAAAAATEDEDVLLVPLYDWIKDSSSGSAANRSSPLQRQGGKSQNETKSRLRRWKEAIIQKATVAYGIVELLNRCPKNNVVLLEDDDAMVCIDNFQVQVCKKDPKAFDVKGVSMISSGLSLSIEEPSYLNFLAEEEGGEIDEQLGRYLEVELDTTKAKKKKISSKTAKAAGDKEMMSKDRCHYLVAKIVYELFTQEVFPDIPHGEIEPAYKRAKTSQSSERGRGGIIVGKNGSDSSSIHTPAIIERMQQLDLPASICRMMQNLLESVSGGGSGDAYKTLGEICQDLHLLLFDPDRFMFDHDEAGNTGGMKLLYRKDKLYGRDKEEKLLTDAFCRVTNGKSEAFFIGGFSGSGKSMLVDTLRVNVKNVGGYVIKHKFDAMSQDRPISGVISAVNQLCLKIKDGLSSKRLTTLSKKLKDDFGADIGLLARMLPNVCLLSPEFSTLADRLEDGNAGDKMSFRSVSFTLLRFIRLVSSAKRPIMLVLDDLQWADDTALDVVHTFLSDTMGSFVFFVGTYRDNEIQVGHAVFDLMENLEISNVPTNKVSLTGLDQEDLNEMISDALCLYPRISKPLSDIVFQKTKGSPFFVLEFMQSLQSRGLLQYDSSWKRWVWNEEAIRAEEITGNVLHLLSSKMNRLSDEMQVLLKVMACFGTSTNKSVFECLNKTQQYSCILDELEGAINDGFVVEDGVQIYKFAHDKVREAAYNLIPDRDKKKFHYNLGKILSTAFSDSGKDDGETSLLIASQINHGKESFKKDNLCMPAAKLNMKAGKKALDGGHFQTAYSYLDIAQSLLPDDNWESCYELSLHLNFLLARAANSSCKYDVAKLILQTIGEKARCFEDKLPSYYLLVTMFLSQGKVVEAYETSSSILSQLGETVPEVEAVTLEMVGGMVVETLGMYAQVAGDEWLAKKVEDSTLINILNFFSVMATAAYFCKPMHIVGYFVCRSVQLSLQNGVCHHTPLALMQLSFIAIKFDNASFISGIAKNAMGLAESLKLSDRMAGIRLHFYMGAGHLESFQVGASQLRKGFGSGLSSGDANTAFYCAIQGTFFSIISGEKELCSLLQEIDYYLHLLKTYKSEMTRKYLLCYRETVSILIDKGEATGIEDRLRFEDVSDPGNKLLEVFYFHELFRHYWLGHPERSNYYIKKYGEIIQPRYFEVYVVKFYSALNLLSSIKKKMNVVKSDEVDEIIESMKIAASHAGPNFRNKLELLKAEQYGACNYPDKAMTSYNASIESARKNNYIHEQGLACEMAGFYCKRMRYTDKSLEYFNMARKCYEAWGSAMKVEFIQRELDKFT